MAIQDRVAGEQAEERLAALMLQSCGVAAPAQGYLLDHYETAGADNSLESDERLLELLKVCLDWFHHMLKGVRGIGQDAISRRAQICGQVRASAAPMDVHGGHMRQGGHVRCDIALISLSKWQIDRTADETNTFYRNWTNLTNEVHGKFPHALVSG